MHKRKETTGQTTASKTGKTGVYRESQPLRAETTAGPVLGKET